jgi:hypothetical protein
MTEMAKVTINWAGLPGGPGYTNLYFQDFGSEGIDQTIANGSAAKVDAWLGAWDDYLPPAVSVRVNSTVEVVESTTGALQRFITVPSNPLRQGAGSGVYSAASGACLNWYTTTVRNSRRIRGRTFMVPIAGNGLDTTGTLNDTAVGLWTTATNTLINATGAGDLGVWARPTAPGASDGVWSLVSSFTLPDRAAILTSRRS